MTNANRFYVLDSFRGLAALLVCLYHMPNMSLVTNNIFIVHSGVFVDLFFVLSGFVIFHNYKDKIKDFRISKSFMIKRFKRLIPLHIYTLLIILVLELFKLWLHDYLPFSQGPFEFNTMSSFWSQLFLLNSTPLFMGFNWNSQNWSISAEIISYIVFVLTSLVWIGKKYRKIVISIVVVFLGYLFFYLKYETLNVLVDFNFSFIRGIIGFYIGILIYLLRTYINPLIKTVSNNLFNILELFSILMTVYVVSNLNLFQQYFFLIHLVFGLLLLIFSYEKGVLSLLLKQKIFQNLGLWSYSIYLNHIFIITLYRMVVLKLIGINRSNAIFFEIFMIIALCYYSYLTFNFIEKRFYKGYVELK